MKKWELDCAVLCIFFARPAAFEKCFEQVRKVRPRVLLLWQDGPRSDRPDDVENIEKCRAIAENIDWDCEVHTCYHETNMGCDPSTFLSHKWAFSVVDKCIILEDDLVVTQSFFHFCKDMLDKYEDDERIDRICGTNLLGTYDIPYDYFFSRIGNSTGWATWRRVADTWNEQYEFLQFPYEISCMRAQQPDLKSHLAWEKACEKHASEKVPYWEFIIGARTLLYNGLVIYPRVNLVENVGLDVNSTHAPASKELLAKSSKYLFELPSGELIWPLRCPPYMIADDVFSQKCRDTMTTKGIRKYAGKLESFCRKIWHKK